MTLKRPPKPYRSIAFCNARLTGRTLSVHRNASHALTRSRGPSDLLRKEEKCSATTTGIRLHLPIITDRKSTRLNSSHVEISYAVFCLKKKKKQIKNNKATKE